MMLTLAIPRDKPELMAAVMSSAAVSLPYQARAQLDNPQSAAAARHALPQPSAHQQETARKIVATRQFKELVQKETSRQAASAPALSQTFQARLDGMIEQRLASQEQRRLWQEGLERSVEEKQQRRRGSERDRSARRETTPIPQAPPSSPVIRPMAGMEPFGAFLDRAMRARRGLWAHWATQVTRRRLGAHAAASWHAQRRLGFLREWKDLVELHGQRLMQLAGGERRAVRIWLPSESAVLCLAVFDWDALRTVAAMVTPAQLEAAIAAEANSPARDYLQTVLDDLRQLDPAREVCVFGQVHHDPVSANDPQQHPTAMQFFSWRISGEDAHIKAAERLCTAHRPPRNCVTCGWHLFRVGTVCVECPAGARPFVCSPACRDRHQRAAHPTQPQLDRKARARERKKAQRMRRSLAAKAVATAAASVLNDKAENAV